MRKLLRAVTASSVVLLLGLILAGCATAGPDGVEAPGMVETETASAPNPLVSVDCDGLITLTAVQAALGTVEATPDPVRVPGGTWALSHLGLAQAGSLHCYWGDDAALQRTYARYLTVTVRPNAAEAWYAWESQLGSWSTSFAGHGDAAFSRCDGSSDYLYCQYDVLIGTDWLRAEVMNLDAHEDAAPIIRSLTDAVAAADPVDQAWAAPTTAAALPASCAEFLTAAEIGATVKTEGLAERQFPLSMPIILNTAHSPGLACSWSNSYSSEQAMPIQVAVLPGAEWAWESAWAKPRPDRSPAAAVPGLGDHAYAGCAADESDSCFVDVLADGIWIAVDGNEQAGIDGLREVAAAAVAKLAG